MNALAEMDTQELRKDIAPVVAFANTITVTNGEEMQRAFDLRKQCKNFEKKVKDFFAKPKKQADELHANLCAMEKAELAPAMTALGVIDAKVSAYEKERKAKEVAERERLELAARKLAEEQAIARAAAAEASGDNKKAEAIISAPLQVAPVQMEKPKIEGGSFRTDYYGTIIDLQGLITAVVNKQAPWALLELKKDGSIALQSNVNAFAKTTKGEVPVPGVVFDSKQVPINR